MPWYGFLFLDEKIDALNVKVSQILSVLQNLKNEGVVMAGELQALTAQVAQNTSAEASAITLLQGLKAALDAAIANNDTSALVALSNELGASQQALAAAIIANTPTPPPSPPAPSP